MDSRSRPDIRCLWQIFKQATSSSTIELLCRCEHVADEQTMRRLDDMINRNRSNYIKQMRNSFREHQKATRLAKLNLPSTTTLPQTKKKKNKQNTHQRIPHYDSKVSKRAIFGATKFTFHKCPDNRTDASSGRKSMNAIASK